MKTREDLIKYIDETKEYALGLFEEDPEENQDFEALISCSYPPKPFVDTPKARKRNVLTTYLESVTYISLELFDDKNSDYSSPKQVVIAAINCGKI